MKITRITGGFQELLDSDTITFITFSFRGTYAITYRNGITRTASTEVEIDAANCSNGIPLSPDETLMFIGTWYSGLYAVEVKTGKPVWRYRPARITTICVFQSYVVAVGYGHGLVKLDMKTGKVLGNIKTGTAVTMYALNSAPHQYMDYLNGIFHLNGERFLLVDCVRGKLSIVDAESMEVVKTYSNKTLNPTNRLAICTQGIRIDGNTLFLLMKEDNPNISGCLTETFERLIDVNWKRGIN